MKPEAFTQAYHAGVILAMVHNNFSSEKTPSFVEGCVHHSALPELLGSRLWALINSRVPFRKHINLYNSFTVQPSTPRSLWGDATDFALGYVHSYKNSKLKMDRDKQRLLDFRF